MEVCGSHQPRFDRPSRDGRERDRRGAGCQRMVSPHTMTSIGSRASSRAHAQAPRETYVGRIFVLDTTKGGVASAWMPHEMRSRDNVPLAIVFAAVNPILVQGASFGEITLLAGFDEDVTAAIPNGVRVEIDPAAKSLRVV